MTLERLVAGVNGFADVFKFKDELGAPETVEGGDAAAVFVFVPKTAGGEGATATGAADFADVNGASGAVAAAVFVVVLATKLRDV